MSSALWPQERYFRILVEFLTHEETIIAAHNLHTLQELGRVLCDRRPGGGKIILGHDNE
jgi:hypothetical protein